MAEDLGDLSRAVSHALRHQPWVYELELDEQGWVNTGTLLAALRRELPAWPNLSEADLAEMVRTSSKQRHELSNGRIRALYGHSLAYKIDKIPDKPPVQLFHGTSPLAVAGIQAAGLLPMGRQYVHLSLDRETAVVVGRRKCGNPAVFVVLADEAWKAGVVFYKGNNKVWLADRVPPEFLVVE